jgi:catechol 2,3-dioxygenase-like lactoylglutathione lyase family enzyme
MYRLLSDRPRGNMEGWMNVLRVGFVGTRTANVESTASFFRDVLGLGVVRDDPEWSILQLPTGRLDFVEVYAQDFNEERVAPAGVSLFVAFVVDDLEGAHREVREAGIEVSNIVWAAEAFDSPSLEDFGWFFLHAPDGNVYVIEGGPE